MAPFWKENQLVWTVFFFKIIYKFKLKINLEINFLN
jgi:hypothetical protein